MSPAPNHAPAKWAVVVFASRESLDMVLGTVNAAQIAAQGVAAIDILVNGNLPLAIALADQLGIGIHAVEAVRVRVWSVTVGDKANAWNQYIQHIWSGEDIAFFIDGYVRLNSNAVRLLGDAVAAQDDVLGGTGVPSVGRTSGVMRSDIAAKGGFHGNFCCMKGNIIEQLRKRNIALPMGLYRVDALMGALLMLGLDPVGNTWKASRIFVHPKELWQTDPKHWWRLDDLRSQIKRIFRQSRGDLENLALRDHLRIRKLQPELLPSTAIDLIIDWVQRCPEEVSALIRWNPLARRVLAEIRRTPSNTKKNLTPKLMGSIGLP